MCCQFSRPTLHFLDHHGVLSAVSGGQNRAEILLLPPPPSTIAGVGYNETNETMDISASVVPEKADTGFFIALFPADPFDFGEHSKSLKSIEMLAPSHHIPDLLLMNLYEDVEDSIAGKDNQQPINQLFLPTTLKNLLPHKKQLCRRIPWTQMRVQTLGIR